jgi:hypothetical protein
MTLRDELGEVEVGIGDLFDVKDATFSVICPEMTIAHPPIWVRLHAGVLILEDGRRFEIHPDSQAPVFLFTEDLVARCVRATRLKSGQLSVVAGQHPAQSDTKGSRARTSKKDADKSQPNSGSLF